jgi:hypothetical protein
MTMPGYRLDVPFLVDGGGYTDSERLAFCLGYEFGSVVEWLREGPSGTSRLVHVANEDRIRLFATREGLDVRLDRVDDQWMRLIV